MLKSNQTMTHIDNTARVAVEGWSAGEITASTQFGRFTVRDARQHDRGPYISTYTGRFYPFDPRADDFNITDVAHGLANICRYTGACLRNYTVAEHSVHIYRWLCAQGATQEERQAGLLHDAPEALSGFGDVSRPAKQRAPIIKETEEDIWQEAIAPKFRLPLSIPKIVHEADNRIIADEMGQNMHEVDPGYREPLGITLEFWSHQRAEAEFLRAFYHCERLREMANG